MLCFFFNDPAPTAIYTLSLHDALPIWGRGEGGGEERRGVGERGGEGDGDNS